ncbi:MAG: DUF4231 domain-containing protein [Bacteroidota bacterium]|nr:DUF4231 domain-containing protein [Bacteroidota bacterium]
MSSTTISTTTIETGNRQLTLITAGPAANGEQLAGAAGVSGKPAGILLFGGAGSLAPQLSDGIADLFANGLLPAATAANAFILDGGTAAGVMAIVGQAAADQGFAQPLVGISPEALVSYPGKTGEKLVALELNHSHQVLVGGTTAWGGETATLLKLALASGADLLCVVTGGGEVTAAEVLQAVQHQLPVLVFSGSGGFADKLIEAHGKPDTVTDPSLQTIIKEGELYFCRLDSPAAVVSESISRLLGHENILASAWQAFANYDLNAGQQQTIHKGFQGSIIVLGVLVAGLGIGFEVFLKNEKAPDDCLKNFAQVLLVILPVVVTVLIAAANKFKNGLKWVFYRAAAEAVKREIYNFRTHTGVYRQGGSVMLAQRLSAIRQKAMHTDINSTHTSSYKGKLPPPMAADDGKDDGFSRLDPAHYVTHRLQSQLDFYSSKVSDMNTALTFYNWGIYIVTGLGTLLAVWNAQVWVALTTSIVAATGSWLGYQQWDNTRSKYNQGIADLSDSRDWWNALLPADRQLRDNIDKLVARTEQILQTEYDGWAQQMQQTLAEMARQREEEQQKKKKTK